MEAASICRFRSLRRWLSRCSVRLHLFSCFTLITFPWSKTAGSAGEWGWLIAPVFPGLYFHIRPVTIACAWPFDFSPNLSARAENDGLCSGRLRASPPVTGSRCTLAVLVLINISAGAGSHATGPRPLPREGAASR